QSRQADFGILERLEVQDVFKFFLEALLGLFPFCELHFPTRLFQNVSDIVVPGFTVFTMFSQKFSAQLVDFRGGPSLDPHGARGAQDHLSLGFQFIRHLLPLWFGPAACASWASFVGGSAGWPFSRR